MRFANPSLLGSLNRFNERFVGPIERQRDRNAQHLLKRLIGPFVLRRNKTEVLQELPSRTELILRVAPEDLDHHVLTVAAAARERHGFADSYTYVAQVGRATLIEIHFITPPGWPLSSVAQLDAIRQEVGDAIGDEGPNRWLTISFTEDPAWAF